MRTTHYAGMGGTILASRGLARGFLIPNQDGSKAPRARQAPDYITSQPFAVRTPQIKMSQEFWANVFPFRIILSVSIIKSALGEIADSNTTFIVGKKIEFLEKNTNAENKWNTLMKIFAPFFWCACPIVQPLVDKTNTCHTKKGVPVPQCNATQHNGTRAWRVIGRESLPCHLWNSLHWLLLPRLVEECA